MPSSSEHRDKADRNRAFAGAIAQCTFPEWKVVSIFYLAVHLAERLAACDKVHHENHKERLDYLRRKHKKIHTAFKHLYEASLTARYDTVHRFGTDYPAAAVTRLETVDLPAIEAYVTAHFSTPTPAATPSTGS